MRPTPGKWHPRTILWFDPFFRRAAERASETPDSRARREGRRSSAGPRRDQVLPDAAGLPQREPSEPCVSRAFSFLRGSIKGYPQFSLISVPPVKRQEHGSFSHRIHSIRSRIYP